MKICDDELYAHGEASTDYADDGDSAEQYAAADESSEASDVSGTADMSFETYANSEASLASELASQRANANPDITIRITRDIKLTRAIRISPLPAGGRVYIRSNNNGPFTISHADDYDGPLFIIRRFASAVFSNIIFDGGSLSGKANKNALLVSGGNLLLEEGAVAQNNDNQSDINGGGVIAYDGTLWIRGAYVYNNKTIGDGGGAYIVGKTNVYLSGARIAENEAENGGGVYLDKDVRFIANDNGDVSEFSENRADKGYAMYFVRNAWNANLDLDPLFFNGNHSRVPENIVTASDIIGPSAADASVRGGEHKGTIYIEIAQSEAEDPQQPVPNPPPYPQPPPWQPQPPDQPPHPSQQQVLVKFNSGGGTPVKSESIAVGERVSEPYPPSRNCDIFAGWTTDATGKNMWHFSNPVPADMTLYANWIARACPPRR
ncbi:MAG: InlB B-repeat-containing protein [Oscillospiraceae bacterium]|jgi:uncharacterized repeat protein (TIGR02543 family)|nr:InlB B-repeat-containing protein [Oscillospiraceae bacterium]